MMHPHRVIIAGDWHGSLLCARRVINQARLLLPDEFPRIILHAGDFGIWPGEAGYEYVMGVNRALHEQGAMLWFIDGNHEDFTQIEAFPHPFGGGPSSLTPSSSLGYVAPCIYHIPRGHRWSWNGFTWLGLGGAVSVDKALCTEGIDWWPQETLTTDQILCTLDGPHDVEVMLTHDCPSGVPLVLPPPPASWSPADLARAEQHRDLLQAVTETLAPRHLIHGHLHMSYQRNVLMDGSYVEVTGLSHDGTYGNWGVFDTLGLNWVQVPGSPYQPSYDLPT